MPAKNDPWINHSRFNKRQKVYTTARMSGHIIGRSGSWDANAAGARRSFRDLREAKKWVLATLEGRAPAC